MRWLVRFFPTDSSGGSFLSSVRALAKSVGAEARNPKWTSSGGLEIDVFSPTAADFETFLAAVDPLAKPEFVTDLNRAPEHLTDDQILSRARTLFNSERFWECHEVLEGLWRQKQGEEKRLLQGMILLCAALVHHQKGEHKVALGVLGRGAKQLEYPEPSYGGFDIRALRARADRMLQTGQIAVFRV